MMEFKKYKRSKSYDNSLTKADDSLPSLAPVSDSSASSIESSTGPHYPEEYDAENVSIPEVINEVAICHDDADASICRACDESDKHVRFGCIEIRNYPVTLGDHPDCAVGPPITIGWEPFKTYIFSVDDYEVARPADTRRKKTDMILSWMDRKKLLRRTSSASDEEIRAAMCDVQRTRKQRARTNYMTPFAFVELPFQSMKRKIQRRFSS